jgi:hypothetical protein
MLRAVAIIGLVVMLSQRIWCQPESLAFAGDNPLKLSPGDTIAYLNIPGRPDDAVSGSVFAHRVARLSPQEREKAIAESVLAGIRGLVGCGKSINHKSVMSGEK